MSFDERARLTRRARQFGRRCQITREGLRKSRAEQEFADNYSGAHALLSEESDEPRVGLSQVLRPSIRANEDHDFYYIDTHRYCHCYRRSGLYAT
jgi:hypothetical protein